MICLQNQEKDSEEASNYCHSGIDTKRIYDYLLSPDCFSEALVGPLFLNFGKEFPMHKNESMPIFLSDEHKKPNLSKPILLDKLSIDPQDSVAEGVSTGFERRETVKKTTAEQNFPAKFWLILITC